HRRIDAAGEREDAGEAEVALVLELDVLGGVERLVLDPGDGREGHPGTLRLRVVELAAPLVESAEAGLRLLRPRHSDDSMPRPAARAARARRRGRWPRARR